MLAWSSFFGPVLIPPVLGACLLWDLDLLCPAIGKLLAPTHHRVAKIDPNFSLHLRQKVVHNKGMARAGRPLSLLAQENYRELQGKFVCQKYC